VFVAAAALNLHRPGFLQYSRRSFNPDLIAEWSRPNKFPARAQRIARLRTSRPPSSPIPSGGKYEREGRVIVSAIDADKALSIVGNPQLEMVAKQVKEKLRRVIDGI
jgi:hypothetical protein